LTNITFVIPSVLNGGAGEKKTNLDADTLKDAFDNLADKEKTVDEMSRSISFKYISHDVIRINGNGDFDSSHGVVGGSGTQSDPYIISGWEIDARHKGVVLYEQR